MRARLVADATIHIWSTDKQPKSNIPLTKYNANGAQDKTCWRKICYINMSLSIDVTSPFFCRRLMFTVISHAINVKL
jgi:hypothetical protein